MNLRMKINISLVRLTHQANLFEVDKLGLDCESHLNCRSTEIIESVAKTSSSADLPRMSARVVTIQ